MRACLVILVAAVMLLISISGSTLGPPATADAMGAQDALEAESGSEEEEPSGDDAAHLQATHGHAAAPRRGTRPSACLDHASDDGHRVRLFRPPIA